MYVECVEAETMSRFTADENSEFKILIFTNFSPRRSIFLPENRVGVSHEKPRRISIVIKLTAGLTRSELFQRAKRSGKPIIV